MLLAAIPKSETTELDTEGKKETPKAEAKEVKIDGDAIDDNAMASLLGI